jgi:hypothetical protein
VVVVVEGRAETAHCQKQSFYERLHSPCHLCSGDTNAVKIAKYCFDGVSELVVDLALRHCLVAEVG